MKKIISVRTAGLVLLAAFGLLAVFHVLVLLQIVPSTIVWGGQIGGSAGSRVTLEIVSLLITLVFAAIVAAKLGYFLPGRWSKEIKILLWLIFAYLVLNALGNLASISSLETWIFTPLTILMAFMALRLAVEK